MYKLLFWESVKVRDVAVVFSLDQWAHLSPEERKLYMDVMLDNCDCLCHWVRRSFLVTLKLPMVEFFLLYELSAKALKMLD